MPFMFGTHGNNYTIPRKIRELQWRYRTEIRTTIIPYQEKLGNYNNLAMMLAIYLLYHTKKN